MMSCLVVWMKRNWIFTSLVNLVLFQNSLSNYVVSQSDLITKFSSLRTPLILDSSQLVWGARRKILANRPANINLTLKQENNWLKPVLHHRHFRSRFGHPISICISIFRGKRCYFNCWVEKLDLIQEFRNGSVLACWN